MIDLYGVLQEQETVNGELGLGVDYYKGEKGEQGIPGKDGSDQVYVGADEPTDERVKLWIDTDATPPSKAVSWDEIENKPEIPAPYTLPTASTSTLGGVKVDGNTITIADGVISTKGKTEPDAYIKDASVSGNTLTLTKKDNTNVVFTPSGGSSGGGAPSYALKLKDIYTAEDISHIEAVKADRNIQMTIDNFPVIGFYDVDLGHGSVVNYIVTDDNDFSMVRNYQYRQGIKIQVASFKSKFVKHLQWGDVSKNSDLPGWIMDWVKNPYQYLVTVDDGGIVIRVDKAMFQNPPNLNFDYISMVNGEPTLTKYCSIYFTNMDMNAYNPNKNPRKGTKDTILTASNYSKYIK